MAESPAIILLALIQAAPESAIGNEPNEEVHHLEAASATCRPVHCGPLTLK
jgi:hypothetical protein